MGNDNSPADPSAMDHTIASLLRDMLRFVADERDYFEVMEAWRTSCPRLPIWEEATERALVTRARNESGLSVVRVTAKGRGFLLADAPNSGPAS